MRALRRYADFALLCHYLIYMHRMYAMTQAQHSRAFVIFFFFYTIYYKHAIMTNRHHHTNIRRLNSNRKKEINRKRQKRTLLLLSLFSPGRVHTHITFTKFDVLFATTEF